MGKTLYANIIRTSDDGVYTDISEETDWLSNVERFKAEIPGIEEVHMCAIAYLDGESTVEQRNMAMQWIHRHLE